VQVHLGLIIIAKVALILSLLYIALLSLLAYAKHDANERERESISLNEFWVESGIMILGLDYSGSRSLQILLRVI
jgi:hypothetical protein